jgi:dephospho-CoA kinase
VLGKPDALARLERILHPMVEREEREFVARARRHSNRAVVLDIPLLFETHGDRRVDHVIVVTAPPAVQMQRIRRRRGMSDADIKAVIARQMPDAQKRRRADTIIHTGLSRHHSWKALSRLVREVRT